MSDASMCHLLSSLYRNTAQLYLGKQRKTEWESESEDFIAITCKHVSLMQQSAV